MINKYYVKKLKKLLEKNTRYYNKERAGEPLPYIITDEKDYYLIKLYLEKLTDKNDITDGLVDILENRVIEQQKILDKIKEELNNLYNADQSEKNYIVFVEKVDKLLERNK